MKKGSLQFLAQMKKAKAKAVPVYKLPTMAAFQDCITIKPKLKPALPVKPVTECLPCSKTNIIAPVALPKVTINSKLISVITHLTQIAHQAQDAASRSLLDSYMLDVDELQLGAFRFT
jgi:hypothetical protein